MVRRIASAAEFVEKKNFDAVTAYCETGLGGYFKKGKAFFFSLLFIELTRNISSRQEFGSFRQKSFSRPLRRCAEACMK